MTTIRTQIEELIDQHNLTQARDLLRDELRNNPSAETYYLASQVAVVHAQRRHFLEKAIELDPFHKEAHQALQELVPDLNAHMDTPRKRKTGYSQSFDKPKRSFDYELAGTGRRFVALFLDLVILFFLGIILNVIIELIFPAPAYINYASTREYNVAFNAWYRFTYLSGVALNAAYYIFTLSKMDGQTLGKRAMGIRVVRTDGQALSMLDAFLRNVIGYFVSIITIFIGFIWAIFDKENQAVHDKIAGTIVIRNR